MAGVLDTVRAVARDAGFRYPEVLVATVLQESNGNPRAVGDSGHSVGIFQEHDRGRGAGLSVAQRQDVVGATQRAIREFTQVLQRDPALARDPGRWAALAQRPLDPGGYAQQVNARVRDLGSAAGSAVRAAGSAAGSAAARVWPIAGARPGSNITNPFGGAQIKTAGYEGLQSNRNNGLDIGARAGTPIVAPASGRVVSVGTGSNSGWGNSVLLEDAQGNRHRLSHMQDVPLVKAGQTVQAGQRLGAVGMTGNATGPHLDYEYQPRGGGFANPLTQEFAMASGDFATGSPGPSRGYGPMGAGSAPPPGGPGGEGDRDKPVAEQIRDALARVRADIAAAKYPEDKARLQGVEQALLRDLAGLDRGATTESDAERALKEAQAEYYRTRAGQEAADRAAADQRAREQNASAEAIAAAQREASRYNTDVDAETSRYGTDVGAETSRYGTDVSAGVAMRGQDLQAAQHAANLQWEQEQGRILQAFNDRKLSWEQAVAAATEAKGRLELQLTQQRNAIEAAGLEAQQRGQDFSGAVTQRGQDMDAGVATRGQDIGRLNQATQSGASLLGQALSTAGQIGNATGQTALGALPFVAPPGTGQYLDALRTGRPATAPGPMALPFDPTTIVQAAADAAYARFAPAGQQLLAAGQAPSPAFVAPPQIAAPPRVVPNVQQIQLGTPMLQAGGPGFVAP